VFRLSLTVENELVVDRVLAGMDERAKNPSPAWPAVVKAFQAIVARAFATEGASTGAPWPALAARTQAERRRLGFGPAHPILERTGTLLRALTLGDGAAILTTATTLRYVVGEDAGYFRYHQSKAPRSRLPRRAPVEFTADDRTAIVRPIRLYITGHDPDATPRAAFP
jgi:hypothetical protein